MATGRCESVQVNNAFVPYCFEREPVASGLGDNRFEIVFEPPPRWRDVRPWPALSRAASRPVDMIKY